MSQESSSESSRSRTSRTVSWVASYPNNAPRATACPGVTSFSARCPRTRPPTAQPSPLGDGGAQSHGEGAARLMELLGLSEEELCRTLDADPLTLLSGQLEHRSELPILLDLLGEASEQAGPAVLRRWVRVSGPVGRPIDALLRRDFGAFEDALSELAERGFVLRAAGG